MKPVLRWGAIAALLILIAPLAFMPLSNGLAWWVIAYFSLKGLVPVEKRPLVPALAVLCGLLAASIAVVLASPTVWPSYIDVLLLAAGMVWMYLSLSRVAAGALIVFEVLSVAAFFVAFAMTPEVGRDRASAVLLIATSLQRAVAIYLLAEFAWRPKPEPDVAPLFD